MNNKKQCIVTFASHNKANYLKGLSRLSESLTNNFDGDLLAFTSEKTIQSPLHSDNPYAFKVMAIMNALDAGYRQILWLDCSVFAIAPLAPIFDELSENGIVYQSSEHKLGNWTNDFTLDYFGITRDEAMAIDCIGDAGYLGFDFDNPIGYGFFNKWHESYLSGCFKGKWANNERTESEDVRCLGHRHDLSCSSAIRHLMGLPKSSVKRLQYAGVYELTESTDIILKAQGI